MTTIVDKAVSALKELVEAMPPTERHEFAGKISNCFAAGELTSVGTGVTDTAQPITSLCAATAEAARTKLTPIQAANAGPNNAHLVRNIMARAARLGYRMKENEKVDPVEMDRAFAGKDVGSRLQIEADMSSLRLI
jgi:hypothetical protein